MEARSPQSQPPRWGPQPSKTPHLELRPLRSPNLELQRLLELQLLDMAVLLPEPKVPAAEALPVEPRSPV